MERLSLFDILYPPKCFEPAIAINRWTGQESVTVEPSAVAKALVPGCECVVMVDTYVCALKKVDVPWDEVPVGHEFYHYRIGDDVYAGTFVGSGSEPYEDED